MDRDRLPTGRRPVRHRRSGQPEPGPLVQRPGGPQFIGHLQHEVQPVRRGPADRLVQQRLRHSLPPHGRGDEQPAHLRCLLTGQAGVRLTQDQMTRDRHLHRGSHPRAGDAVRGQPPGRVRRPVRRIAARLMDGRQHLNAPVQVASLTGPDPDRFTGPAGHTPQPPPVPDEDRGRSPGPWASELSRSPARAYGPGSRAGRACHPGLLAHVGRLPFGRAGWSGSPCGGGDPGDEAVAGVTGDPPAAESG